MMLLFQLASILLRHGPCRHAFDGEARVAIRLHVPQTGFTPLSLQLEGAMQVRFGRQVAVFVRSQGVRVPAFHALPSIPIVLQQGLLGFDLFQTHQAVLAGFEPTKPIPFFDLIHAEQFQLIVMQASLTGFEVAFDHHRFTRRRYRGDFFPQAPQVPQVPLPPLLLVDARRGGGARQRHGRAWLRRQQFWLPGPPRQLYRRPGRGGGNVQGRQRRIERPTTS